MVLMKGDMWDVFNEVDYFLITTNPIVNKQGLAVMGRGIAKQAANRFPDIRKRFGDLLLLDENDMWNIGHIAKYGNTDVWYFMVKRHWADDADPRIIKASALSLAALAVAMPRKSFALNFPGIGNGNLNREYVLPLLKCLPDNVSVWEYE